MKLIASNQMTLTNLLEKVETRRETFYKLTNSADAPEVPSGGGRNYLRGTSNEYQTYTNSNYILGYPSTYRDWSKLLDPLRDKTVTIKAYIKNDTDYPVRIQIWFTAGGIYGNTVAPHSEGWSVKTGKMSADWTAANVAFVQGSDGTAPGGTIQVKEAKAEISESATPYSQAPEDLGWSTATLVPTQEQRYLWKFEYIYYSDGSVEITQPTNISIAGVNGTNGQTSHVHFAFADNATGGGFSLTTPKAYMGWYADFNEAASTDPTKYRWGKWKGDQGLPGKPGADGKTSYFHMAYADSADGRTGFSFTESGQQYQGYYTDFTQTSSTDPTKYVWVDRLANVKVGGVNLLRNSKSFTGSNISGSAKLLTETYNGCAVRYLKTSAWGEIAQFSKCVVPEVNSVYTASFWAKGNGKIRAYFYGDPNYLPVLSGITSQNVTTSAGDGSIDFTVTTEWKRYWVTYKLKSSFPTTDTTVAKHFLLRHLSSTAEEEFWVAGYKLENGNVPTPYTRNPEDVQSDIDSKADQALTQQQLNALAEKNRNMEAELAAKASLETIEQWKQAYDAYVAQNDRDKSNHEQNLVTLSTRLAEWVKDWEDKKVQWSFLDTNMDFGEEGLRLGKKGSPTSIMISNDRISFFSGGSEVASMSNGTLTIDNGIFAKSLQIGHYREEVYEGDKNINVIRWVD